MKKITYQVERNDIIRYDRGIISQWNLLPGVFKTKREAEINICQIVNSCIEEGGGDCHKDYRIVKITKELV